MEYEGYDEDTTMMYNCITNNVIYVLVMVKFRGLVRYGHQSNAMGIFLIDVNPCGLMIRDNVAL